MKHRRMLSLLSAAIMGISAAFLPNTGLIAEAATLKYNGFYYDVMSNNTIIITGYYGSQKVPEIPKQIYEKTVTTIDTYAFRGKPISGVVISESVTDIQMGAFANCTSLQTLNIKGPAHLEKEAFLNCSSLTDIYLNKKCTFEKDVFNGCKSVETINRIEPWSKRSDGKPMFTNNSIVRELISTSFIRCDDDINFINDYCDALCTYIVNTETRDWMSDMLKARQLHDWLIRHCEYEDCKQGEDIGDPENQNCCGLFVSYAFGTRGGEIGESVCTGYSKAYQKLLDKCGIKSELLYELGNDTRTNAKLNHVWNLVEIDKKYYHCDVTQDNNLTDGSNMAYGTHYSSFMRSTYDMYSEHLAQNSNYHTVNQDKTTDSAKKALNNCSSNSMRDNNQDGILDGDWNFDGAANRRDSDYYRALCLMIYNCLGQDIKDKGVDYMPEYVSILKDLGWSPDYLYNTFG